MRRSVLLSFAPLILAIQARAGSAQATPVRSIKGDDERGKYEVAWIELTSRAAEPSARRRVNADLEREARAYICDPEPDAERRRHFETWYEMEVTYRSARLLGVVTRKEAWCGGASPSGGPGSLIYDLRAGRRIEVEAEMADPRAFRRFVARRALAAVPGDPGECAELYTSEDLARSSYVYVLEERGLVATQDYPRVVMACGYDTGIPYADVARFLKPASPLRALAPR